jgi:hypothetical protein
MPRGNPVVLCRRTNDETSRNAGAIAVAGLGAPVSAFLQASMPHQASSTRRTSFSIGRDSAPPHPRIQCAHNNTMTIPSSCCVLAYRQQSFPQSAPGLIKYAEMFVTGVCRTSVLVQQKATLPGWRTPRIAHL